MEPIEFASIRVYSATDSTVVNGAYSDERGIFSVENVPGGSYYIKIAFSGFQTKTISEIDFNERSTYVLGKIGLSLDESLDLDEVTVIADIDILKAGIDKKIYNVDQDISTRGGSAEGVLNNIPSVAIDEEGNISLRGDNNVTILIDGRPSTLTGSGLLDAIPASSIERIEVVTNPSAKYDPDGTSGIINIVLKKNKLKGFNGQISGTAATGHDHNLNGALSYRNERLNIYGSYAFDYNEGYRNNFGYIEQYFGTDSLSRLDQNRAGTDFRRGHTALLGADFYLNSQSTIGFSITGVLNDRRRTGDQLNERFNSNYQLTDSWQRLSSDPEHNRGIDASVNFNRILKNDKGKWSIVVNESLRNEDQQGIYDQTFVTTNGAPSTFGYQGQRQYSLTDNSVFTAQFDMEYLLPKQNARLEYGAKGILRSENLDASSYTFDSSVNDFLTDTLANYVYTYDESVYSLYGIFGQQIKKFSYQLGVRGEYAIQDPVLQSENISYKKEYFNFYPSAHVRYKTSEKIEYSLSYSRRINRPSSRSLNPFTNYSDPYNLRRGNPDLNPEYVNSYDLGLSWNPNKVLGITGSVFYRQTRDVIQRVKLFGDNNTSVATEENIDESESTGIELIVSLKPTKWWKNTISANGNYMKYSSSALNSNWNNSGFNWSVKYMGVFEFWKKSASIQLNGNFSAPRITAQGKVNPWTYLDISAQKLFLDRKLTLGLRLSDVFNTKGFKYTVDQPSVYQESEFKWLTRRLYFTISYRFGKLEISNKVQSGGGDGTDF